MGGYRQIPYRARLSPDFHSGKLVEGGKNAGLEAGASWQTGCQARLSADCGPRRCTESGQAAVDGLHSKENTRLKVCDFRLTVSIEGVKRHSFFDSFQVFPVGAASGAQARSASHREVKGSEGR
jgi:hypothetical protein